MLSNRFIADTIKNNTEILYKKLQFLENLLNEWFSFQRSWMYLENIFTSADIASKMQSDSKKFQTVDTMWRDFMRGTHNNPSASRVLSGYNLPFNLLMNHISQLQSSEINFLEVLKYNNKILDEI